MITKNEISSLNLSPTKKDFVQIWNELIEVASKITERWDPTSTNESDPGIVLLKVLTGIADKLNYNIDKNILEAYMPTAAQIESMRKLCELVGYDIKYYQSAETKVRISYTGNTTDRTDANDEKLPIPSGLQIPKFTTITNADKDITFVTTNTTPVYLTNEAPRVEVPCIEGQISQCESINENNLITLAQLDAENRYYLPEIQIAENGIFVYNAAMYNGTYIDGMPWTQVSNLNTSATETRVFKFGYDSFEGRPYLAFPEDVGSLIGDGLFIYFIRTSGLNGNISARTLEVLEVPTGKDWENYSAEQFEVVNVDATTNGANIESISAAYNNFKKTVGTFDTLVTCRDYMNKLYSLVDANNTPYVSNILVTDIRNDINSAITLCSCNEFGILYKEMPLTTIKSVPSTSSASTMRVEPRIIDSSGEEATNRLFVVHKDTPIEVKTEVPLIDHFNLRLYPFKTFTQVSAGVKDLVSPYNESFTYTERSNKELGALLADFKTCAHNLVAPAEGDIVAINNYLKLDALIATSTKVSEIEAEAILVNVKVALVNEFNLRNLDFGEEIPFESILSVIENADSRIKVVSLQEPTVLTTYSVKDTVNSIPTSKEYGIASTVDKYRIPGVTYDDDVKTKNTNEANIAKDIYNKLTLRNILAGRASLLDYDDSFISNNSEKPYTVTKDITSEIKDNKKYEDINKSIDKILEDTSLTAVKEHILYTADAAEPIAGPNGGVLTLKIEDDPNKPYILYETYEPSFAIPGMVPNVTSSSIIDNITRVEALCEIKGDGEGHFENIKLNKNEVIKFRAPNLITTKTFPAYVYYRFERAGENFSPENLNDGSYAAAISLNSFINDIGKDTFFNGLWSKAGKDLVSQFIDDSGNLLGTTDLTDIFNTAIAVSIEPSINGKTIYTSAGVLENDLEAYFKGNYASKITIKYYPLTRNTINIWSDYIKERYSEKYDGANLPDGTVLWRLSSTSDFPKGKLVTETGQRLYAQDRLLNVDIGATTYICINHGADPIFSKIDSDSDVELRAGDKLYIHYTPSSTNEDGETVNAEPISIVYEGGSVTDPVIIRPSGFTLMPSDDVNRQGTSWKKTNVDFGSHGKKNLLALAPNEQIELRSISKVVLNKSARFYKNFDNDSLEQGVATEPYELKDGEYIFYTDQNAQEAAYYGSGSVITLAEGAFIPKATEKVEVSQILERGLHIVPWSNIVQLNDKKTITISEYQYRTLVEGDTLNTLAIAPTSENKILGTANSDDNESKWLKCDQTTPISYTIAGAESSTDLPKIMLSSGSSEPSTAWEVCSLLELSTTPGYAQQLSATDTKTDMINVYIDTGTDERLAYTIKPEQTATTGNFEAVSVKLSAFAKSATGNLENLAKVDKPSVKMKIFKEEAPSTIALYEHDDIITPISDKNLGSADTNTVSINNYLTKIDINGELWREVPEVEKDESGKIIGTNVNRPNAFKLNFMIPKDEDMFGIFSIYLDVPVDKLDAESVQGIPSSGARVFIDIPREFGPCQSVLSIFNNKDKWWSEGVDEIKNRLYLRAGLNCIKINKSCSMLIKSDAGAAGSVLYDNMRLVKGKDTNGINLKLLDPGMSFNTEAARIATIEAKKDQTEQDKAELDSFVKAKKELANDILNKIAELDKNHDFYYNVPVENGLAIEFDKNNINSFSNPHTLYDINNINNSFVVSKLAIAYLDEGLRIAKSSSKY